MLGHSLATELERGPVSSASGAEYSVIISRSRDQKMTRVMSSFCTAKSLWTLLSTCPKFFDGAH
jgi:hypothetical protein